MARQNGDCHYTLRMASSVFNCMENKLAALLISEHRVEFFLPNYTVAHEITR
jgi:hypothetical protein